MDNFLKRLFKWCEITDKARAYQIGGTLGFKKKQTKKKLNLYIKRGLIVENGRILEFKPVKYKGGRLFD